jgi:hypothetical protein
VLSDVCKCDDYSERIYIPLPVGIWRVKYEFSGCLYCGCGCGCGDRVDEWGREF